MKRATHWIGYKVHFSETCDEELPRLITQVTTTIAPTPDRHALPEAHKILEERDLLPEQHLVDAGYIDAEALVASRQEHQVDLVGPTAKDYRWQAREQNGYALANFSIDWERQQATCPQGQTSNSWTPTWTRNQEIIKIKFGFATCGACPVRAHCTKRGVQGIVRRACRSRRRSCPGCAHDGLAAFALHWRAANPSSTCRDGNGYESLSDARLVRGSSSACYSSFSFCSLYERGRLMGVLISPPIPFEWRASIPLTFTYGAEN
jgi:hypothetical protein